MHYSDYLREQAAEYRELAAKADHPAVKNDFLDSAAILEEVETPPVSCISGSNNSISRYSLISAIPAEGSNSFLRWAGLSVSTTSQVGRT
jgi:hypothetical protein